MPNIASIIAHNAQLWDGMEILDGRRIEVAKVATRLCAPLAKARYQAIEHATGVPWFVVAVIHEREAGQDFGRQLGQGDPLGQISRHVPRGRGPFFNHPGDPPGQDAFYRAAVDALTNCPPYAARWKDWSAGGTLTLVEEYNGLGYERHGEPSPYDWGATNRQRKGKFTGDGIYSADVWDTQVGCAAMIKAMAGIDPSVAFAKAA
jgi:lysozyme family protein